MIWHKMTSDDPKRRVMATATVMVMVTAMLCCFAAAVSVAAARRDSQPPAFAKSEDVLEWINGYRSKPNPDRLPDAVKAMSQFGLLKDLDQAGLYVGFTAGVLGSNPVTAKRLIGNMFPLPSEHQVLVIRAIAYSGLSEWKNVLINFVERMPSRKVLIDRFVFGNKPTLSELSMKTDESVIDINWGYYFATGAETPVRRIVQALAFSLDQNDVETLTIGSMAKWTLAQNAARDHELLSTLKLVAADTTGPVRVPLGEVIEAAETLELSKIRKSAMASIEDLKRKGPERVRNYNWWGQAGQTVLALGCVAAGALGQVEFGIPCVLGGAVSTAALKYLAPASP